MFIFWNNTGNILFKYAGTNVSGQVQHNLDLDFMVVGDDIDIDQYYIPDINSPTLTSLTASPSIYHQFDYAQGTWVLPNAAMDSAKLAVFRAIEQYADSIHAAPSAYDSKLLDADAVARENISCKVNQLKADIDLSITSTNLFWKDADNVVHSWSSSTVYLDWLQGLVIAIASRRTNLYAAVWQAKADVAALTDIADVLAFDVAAVFA